MESGSKVRKDLQKKGRKATSRDFEDHLKEFARQERSKKNHLYVRRLS